MKRLFHSSLTGWGLGKKTEAEVRLPLSQGEAAERLETRGEKITRGLGRSYGDPSLQREVISSLGLNRFLSWNESRAELVCEAGVLLEEILRHFVPRGFLLPVLPGTKWVTVGGAVSSDVHGKSHHRDGSFSRWVNWIDLLLPSGETVRISKTVRREWFRAVCGGMGLLGVILAVSLKLKKIETSFFWQRTYRADSLAELTALFEKHSGAPYSVAWIDTAAPGKKRGRGFLTTGYPAARKDLPHGREPLPIHRPPRFVFPFLLPSGLLSAPLLRSLIFGYEHLPRPGDTPTLVHYDPFFFPLDGIHFWNRAYGKKGFVQHQCLIPKKESQAALDQILALCQSEGFPSFVTVLKLFGPGNENLLSFPREGFTLCLDFPFNERLRPFLKKLDAVVVRHGGRLYLAKDAVMSRQTFRAGYPNWEKFVRLKKKLDPLNRFSSLQSERLGLTI
ncbi:MAG: FAD-binding oxidoreductase [Spirochaetia bacterium]|nr:FAD-binding oxidoreductase [Spirochaetia bacterium]